MRLTELLNDFSRDNLRRDIFGGITTAVVSLPLALAFGVASGAGAEAGLYGAIIVGLFAAVFGGTPTLISEPTGPMTVVMTAVIAHMLADNPDQGLAMAFTVVMLAGVFQIIFGALKLGRYITLMPYSVISGFMSGIGLILIILQIPGLLGHASPAGGVTGSLAALPELVTNIRLPEFILGAVALGLLFLTPKRAKRIVPAPLLALCVGTVLSVLAFGDTELRRIGEVSLGVPDFIVPTFTVEQLQKILINALVLGVLGCIDSLLTAVIADSLTKQEHRSDAELIGQGIANIASGVFGGLPGAGATMGTVVNIQAGARSAYSGVVRALTLIIMLVGAAQLVEVIPMAVLAAIALHVGFNILDWSFVKRAHRVSVHATVIMYGVMILTVFVDLMVAVGVGVFIANIITIDRLSRVQSRKILTISDADDKISLSKKEKRILDQAAGEILLVYLSGPMIFGVARALAREQSAMRLANVLVVDLYDVPLIDATVTMAIENMIAQANQNNLKVYLIFSPTQESNSQRCQRSILEKCEVETCANRGQALAAAERWLQAHEQKPPAKRSESPVPAEEPA